MVDADSVCKTSSMFIVSFDINLYCVGVGDFKFASNTGLVVRSGVKAFYKYSARQLGMGSCTVNRVTYGK